MNRALSAIFLVGAASAAQGGTLHGTWCNENESLHLDAHGVGANEHTICDATPTPNEAGAFYQAILSCKNVYPGDQKTDGTFDVTEVPLDGPNQIFAMLIGDDQLAVLFSVNGTGEIYDRCD